MREHSLYLKKPTTDIQYVNVKYLDRPTPLHFSLCADCVPFELVLRAALLWRESCGGGGQVVFLFPATIIKRRALSIVHEIAGLCFSLHSSILIHILSLYLSSPINPRESPHQSYPFLISYFFQSPIQWSGSNILYCTLNDIAKDCDPEPGVGSGTAPPSTDLASRTTQSQGPGSKGIRTLCVT
jgi:hypothetical protein